MSDWLLGDTQHLWYIISQLDIYTRYCGITRRVTLRTAAKICRGSWCGSGPWGPSACAWARWPPAACCTCSQPHAALRQHAIAAYTLLTLSKALGQRIPVIEYDISGCIFRVSAGCLLIGTWVGQCWALQKLCHNYRNYYISQLMLYFTLSRLSTWSCQRRSARHLPM